MSNSENLRKHWEIKYIDTLSHLHTKQLFFFMKALLQYCVDVSSINPFCWKIHCQIWYKILYSKQKFSLIFHFYSILLQLVASYQKLGERRNWVPRKVSKGFMISERFQQKASSFQRIFCAPQKAATLIRSEWGVSMCSTLSSLKKCNFNFSGCYQN